MCSNYADHQHGWSILPEKLDKFRTTDLVAQDDVTQVLKQQEPAIAGSCKAERGNISPHFPHLPVSTGLLTQLQKQQRLQYFLLVAVVSFYLARNRLSLSTLSAQVPFVPDDTESPSDGSNNFEVAASYARYSSNNQDVDSNVQQQSKMHEAAHQNHHIILSEFEFSDEAVSGTKLHREGLDRLLDSVRKGLFKILYFWNLSRLAREIAIALPILKQLVHVYGIRVISVADGIDSAKSGWELQSVFGSYMSQEYLKRLAEDVTRGLRACPITLFTPQVDSGRVVLDGAIAGRDIV